MVIAGVDYSTQAVDIVTVPYDEEPPHVIGTYIQDGVRYDSGMGYRIGPARPPAPVWHRFPLEGDGAFERARDVANELPGRNSTFWDDILAVGIEHPGGRYGTGAMLRIQGAILSVIPARMLVISLPPARWRKAVGLPGNATKDQIAWFSLTYIADAHGDAGRADREWPQDAHDAHLIALATSSLITPTVVA